MSVLFTEPKKLYQIFLNIWKELNNEVFSLAVQLAPLLYQLGYRIPGCTSQNSKIMTQNSETTLSCQHMLVHCPLGITAPDIIEKKPDIVLPESLFPG